MEYNKILIKRNKSIKDYYITRDKEYIKWDDELAKRAEYINLERENI